MVFEHDNITGGIGELDFFDNPRFVIVFEPDNITGGIGNLTSLTTLDLSSVRA